MSLFVYYFFGLLPALFFSLRFLMQWIKSEKRKESYVDKSFWYFSICGNFLLSVHYFIQAQYLLFLIQVVNGFISWRNLNLLGEKKIKLKTALAILSGTLLLSSSLFFWNHALNFMAIPITFAETKREISFFWHVLGAMGVLLFASRFWVQWVAAERIKESKLNRNFWVISIVGSLVSLIYFLHTRDWVSVLNYSFGFIPYLRNLILIKNRKHFLTDRP